MDFHGRFTVKIIKNDQLSEHFSLTEFTRSEYASRHDIDNTPDRIALENLGKTAQDMEAVRRLFGCPIAISSAFRSPLINRIVGGSETSDHRNGLAVDFWVPGKTDYQVAKDIEASDLQYDQLILEYGWVHLGFGFRMRRESLTKKSKDSPYVLGLVA